MMRDVPPRVRTPLPRVPDTPPRVRTPLPRVPESPTWVRTPPCLRGGRPLPAPAPELTKNKSGLKYKSTSNT